MRLYAAAGRRSDALRQYHVLERVLREELDTTPSAAAQALAEGIKGGSRLEGLHVRRLEGSQVAEPTASQPSNLSTFKPSNLEPPLSLEPVGGAVPLGSPFYIERRADAQFAEAVARRDRLVLLQG